MRPLPLEVPQFPGFRRLEDAEVPSGKKVLVDADAPKSKDDEPGDAPKRDDAERPDDGRIPKAKSEDDGPGSHILPRPGPMFWSSRTQYDNDSFGYIGPIIFPLGEPTISPTGEPSDMYDRLLIAGWWVAGVNVFIGIPANIVVIGVVASDKQMRHTSMFLLLANLAVSDSTYILTYNIVALFRPDVQSLRRTTIMWAFNCLVKMSVFVSVNTMLAVCLERYYAIVHPLHVRQLFRVDRTVAYIAGLWMSAFAFYGVVLFVFVALMRYYSIIWLRIYVAIEIVATYLIPLLTLMCAYARVCWTLWEVKARIQSAKGKTGTGKSVIQIRLRDDQLAERRKVIKMLVYCVILFFICYTPWTVFNYLWAVGAEEISKRWASAGVTFTVLSCCANPFIYALYSEKFREPIVDRLTRWLGDRYKSRVGRAVINASTYCFLAALFLLGCGYAMS